MRSFAAVRCALVLVAVLPLAAAAAPAKKKPAAAPRSGPDVPSSVRPGTPAAVVNGEPISLNKYVDRLSVVHGPEIRELMVQETLIRQECKKRKITASPAEIEAVVKETYDATVKARGGEKNLTAELKAARGWSPADYKQVIRNEADIQVMRRKLGLELVKDSEAKDDEIEKRYQAQIETFTIPDTVKISHILVKKPEDGNDAKNASAKQRAADILKRVTDAKGANFDALAKAMSEDEITKSGGGRIASDIVRGQHPFGAAFEATVFNTPVGLVSEVIASPLGYHVIRIDAKKAGRTVPLSEVKDQIRTSILAERRNQKLEELFIRLRTNAKVETGRF